jgi:hypothetical protein
MCAMTTKPIIRLAALLALIIPWFAACASTPDLPEGSGALFAGPLEKARQGALDALVVLGFDVKKQEPTYVEGFRPRKIGLLVGSGGETVGVWLEPVGEQRTRVRVDTAKSFVGIAGQKNWDAEVLAQMEKTLGKPQ